MLRLNNILPSLTVATAAVVVSLLATKAQAASQPDDFCTGDPCIVSANMVADGDTDVDFGDRSLIIANGVKIEVGPSAGGGLGRSLGIQAKEITLRTNAEIQGDGADDTIIRLTSTVGAINLQADSLIDVSDADTTAGSIILNAFTDLTIDGDLDASAQGTDAAGGTIDVSAGGVLSTSGKITSRGNGTDASGGDIDLYSAGSMALNGEIETNGQSFGAGFLTIDTDGGLVVGASITCSGGSPGGSGGDTIITASGDIDLQPSFSLEAKGAGPGEECDDGGSLTLEADGSVLVHGDIDLAGGSNCGGGEFEVIAGGDFIQASDAKISTKSPGGESYAGAITISANGSVTLREIVASGTYDGGSLIVTAGSRIEVLDKVDVSGIGNDGLSQNDHSLTACTIDISAPKGEILATGKYQMGEVQINASGLATVSGKLESGENNFFYRTVQPSITGTVDPPPVIQQDLTLIECANSCGDNIVQAPEVCDDGNVADCDGCSSDCSREDNVCGDGVSECTEQCDDGNLIDGDGCDNNCTPSSQDQTGALIESRGRVVGCQAQWRVQIESPAIDNSGGPGEKQICIDGDFGCDADGEKNNSCSFLVEACVNIRDPDLPDCDPNDRVTEITLKKPKLGSNKPNEATNAQKLIESLSTIGATLIADGNVILNGGPVPGLTSCGPPAEVRVPISKKTGKATIKLRTETEGGKKMKTGQVKFTCQFNDAVCGNQEVEPGELCDDGNNESCDGCSNCMIERCGNGIVECEEQCDEGALNGTADSRCDSTCKVLPLDIRIPGGGSKKTDCMFQWSMDISDSAVLTDRRGTPRNKQTCIDNNPACDLDPTVGNCRVRVFGCVGKPNPDSACPSYSVDRIDVKRPKANSKKSFEAKARLELDRQFAAMSLPATADSCSPGITFDIPKDEKIKIAVKAFSGKKGEGDALKIACE